MVLDSLSGKLFQHLEERFYSNHSEFLEDIGKILFLQKSTVYKKLRGESALSLDDVYRLCSHFQIGIDDIIGLHKDMILFEFPNLSTHVFNGVQFLKPIDRDMQQLAKLNPTIYYPSRELPFFYYFNSLPLTAFKFHVFYNINWRDDSHAVLKFDLNQFEQDKEFKEISQRISDNYMTYNSIEIWTFNILDNTLNQIKYFLEGRLFEKPEMSLILCEHLEKLVEKIAQILDLGSKAPLLKTATHVGTALIYNNEISHTNNMIYVNSNTFRAIYKVYDNPNFLRSFSPLLCDYTEKWLGRLINNSTPLSSGNVKDRNNFINHLKSKIEKTKLFIQTYLNTEN